MTITKDDYYIMWALLWLVLYKITKIETPESLFAYLYLVLSVGNAVASVWGLISARNTDG